MKFRSIVAILRGRWLTVISPIVRPEFSPVPKFFYKHKESRLTSQLLHQYNIEQQWCTARLQERSTQVILCISKIIWNELVSKSNLT